MGSKDDYQEFKLNNLQARMDKCTNEQFWVVTTILAINAFFFSTDFLREIRLYKGLLLLILLLIISIYGVWFVIKRHKSYYLYRGEFSKIIKNIEESLNIETPSILGKKPIRNSRNTLSGVVFYCILIIFSAIISITTILSTIFSLGCKCN